MRRLSRASRTRESGGDGSHGNPDDSRKYLRPSLKPGCPSGSRTSGVGVSARYGDHDGTKPTAFRGGSAKSSNKPSKLMGGRGVSSFKPQRTVRLLKGTPCFLPACPAWIKAPTLWSPRLSPRQVDVKTLGWGRYGSQVLLVRHLSHGSTAVMKQFVREKLLASPRLHEKVLDEWRAHAALVPHPNIVPLYGAVEDKSYVTLVLEAEAGDLLSYLDEQDREVLSEDEARAVAADVLSALAHMHDMGFVHRDVKPENVFVEPSLTASRTANHTTAAAAAAAAGLTRRDVSAAAFSSGGGRRGGGGARTGSGGCGCWRLGDLGSAVELERVVRAGGATGLHLEGSPPFLSPEYAALWAAPPASRSPGQLQAATSPKQDIWALGALLYDVLVGHPPFSGGGGAAAVAEPPLPQLLAAICSQPPSPWPAAAGLSAAASDFIEAALRKAPEERPTAAELLTHPWLTAPLAVPPLAAPEQRRMAASEQAGGVQLREGGGGGGSSVAVSVTAKAASVTAAPSASAQETAAAAAALQSVSPSAAVATSAAVTTGAAATSPAAAPADADAPAPAPPAATTPAAATPSASAAEAEAKAGTSPVAMSTAARAAVAGRKRGRPPRARERCDGDLAAAAPGTSPDAAAVATTPAPPSSSPSAEAEATDTSGPAPPRAAAGTAAAAAAGTAAAGRRRGRPPRLRAGGNSGQCEQQAAAVERAAVSS